jgi:cytochrome b6-f complex iron-sulfur subunit
MVLTSRLLTVTPVTRYNGKISIYHRVSIRGATAPQLNPPYAEKKMTYINRRDFLKITTTALLAASGLLGLGGLLRFLDYESEPAPKTVFDLGLATNYASGSQTLLVEVPAMLFHTTKGFSALSLVCTHLGCTVKQGTDGFSCPCHGSRYDPAGVVLRGPAQKPLRSLRVETTSNGHLVLHTD